MVAKTAPHLSDLFVDGEDFVVVYPGKPEVTVWITRPNPGQAELILRKARVERARRYHELTESDSEEMVALRGEVELMKKPEVVDEILARKRRKIEQQAFNDVLFSKETKEDSGVTEFGSWWGPDGQQWTDVLDALIKRMEEIDETNKELRAAEAKPINPQDDEEITRLSEIQEKFQAEVTARYEELADIERRDISTQTVSQLREQVIKDRIELECETVWFTHYKYTQLHYAVRYPDNHEKLYFSNPSAIRSLPKVVQDQLFEKFDELNVDGDSLKNLLTPLPS